MANCNAIATTTAATTPKMLAKASFIRNDILVLQHNDHAPKVRIIHKDHGIPVKRVTGTAR